MVPDGQKVWMDRMDGRMHGRRQKYIPLTALVDNNKQAKSNGHIDLKKQRHIKLSFNNSSKINTIE